MSLNSIGIIEPENLDIKEKLNQSYKLFIEFYNEYAQLKKFKEPLDVLDGYCVYVLLFIIDYYFGSNQMIVKMESKSESENIIKIKDNDKNVKFTFNKSGTSSFFYIKKNNETYNIIISKNALCKKKSDTLRILSSIYYSIIDVTQDELESGIFCFFTIGINFYPSLLIFLQKDDFFVNSINSTFNKIYENVIKLITISTNDNHGRLLGINKITNGFNWFRNSCFIDSLLTMMLFSVNTNFRNILFNYEYDENEYNVQIIDFCKTKKGESIFLDKNKIKNYYNDIQNSLKITFDEILTGNKKDLKCSNIRNIIGSCNPDVTSGEFYSLTEMYDMIAGFFPKLKLKLNYDFDPYYKKNITNFLYLGNYLEDTNNLDFLSESNDFLVIQNNILGGKRLYENLNEENDIVGFDKKTKPLKKTITINSVNYELIGTIININNNHYVLYFKPLWDMNNFYYYDDMYNGLMKKVEEEDKQKMNNDLFKVSSNNIPELYFYQKK